MFVTLEFDANLVVVDTQVTVAVTNHRLRHHLLHFLRHDADIGAVAAVIAEAGSELAERAVKDGIALAKSAGAKVTVIMVAELWFGSQPFMQPWSLQELRKYNEDIKKQVGSVLKMRPSRQGCPATRFKSKKWHSIKPSLPLPRNGVTIS
jgi:nucleotide-binding universal stress UspA family protein